jgi:hypothetical protein
MHWILVFSFDPPEADKCLLANGELGVIFKVGSEVSN